MAGCSFFTFGSTLQATCAGLSLIFLGWVAFASVNVIFKDRIITSKDHRFQQMQASYENRVADLQLSYDELNNALVSAEDRFKSTADQLEAKQQTVANLLDASRSSRQLLRVSARATPQRPRSNLSTLRARRHRALLRMWQATVWKPTRSLVGLLRRQDPQSCRPRPRQSGHLFRKRRVGN